MPATVSLNIGSTWEKSPPPPFKKYLFSCVTPQKIENVYFSLCINTHIIKDNFSVSIPMEVMDEGYFASGIVVYTIYYVYTHRHLQATIW